MIDQEEFQKRLDEASKRVHEMPAQLVPLIKKPVNSGPLPTVPETPPPGWNDPTGTDQERKEGYESGTEAYIAKIEFEQAKAGKIPITYFARKWVGPLLGGIGGGLLGYFLKGCGV